MSTNGFYDNHYYIAGGSLPADALSYVERQADYELYEAILRGDYCYILNSRQMGKSSLRVKVQQKLQHESINLKDEASKYLCISVEVNSFGTQIDEDRWYYSFIDRLLEFVSDSKDFDLSSWWNSQAKLSPVRKLSKFIDSVLLQRAYKKIVIFLDEIDTFISLSFNTDDFFAVIRDCYNQRAENSEYQRLSFVLVGVATPSALMKDKSRTPFNIGRPIELTGFKMAEVQPLISGLKNIADRPKIVIEKIIEWTSGQPFLSQKICNFIVKRGSKIPFSEEKNVVDEIVLNQIIDSWEYHDEPVHLRTIRDRLLNEIDAANRVLWLYQEILQNGEMPSNSENNERYEQILCLSGLVIKKPSNTSRQRLSLTIHNKIYERIFNQQWLNSTLAQIRPYHSKIKGWLASGKTEKQYLLTEEEFKKFESWIKDQALGDDDHSFVQESYFRIHEEAQALKLKNGNIINLEELVDYSDQFPEEIINYLFNERLGDWLFSSLGETGLSDYSTHICDQYIDSKHKGLELFIREVAKKAGINSPCPKISITPTSIDMGVVYFGDVAWANLRIVYEGRGKTWGEVQYDLSLEGINVNKILNYNQSEIKIALISTRARSGKYAGNLYVKIEGTNQIVPIKLNYTIAYAQETVSVNQINFGRVFSNEPFREQYFSISSNLDKAKIVFEYSRDSISYIQLRIDPESCYQQDGLLISKGNNLDVCLRFYPRKVQNFSGGDEKLRFKVNEKTYSIKLNFNIVKVENVIFRAAALLSSVGLILGWGLRKILGSLVLSLELFSRSQYLLSSWIVNLPEKRDLIYTESLFSQLVGDSSLEKILLGIIGIFVFCCAGAYFLGINRSREDKAVELRSFRFFFFLLLGIVLFIILILLVPYLLTFVSYLFATLFVAIENVANQPNELYDFLYSSGSNIGGERNIIYPDEGWALLGASLGCALGVAAGFFLVKERRKALVVFYVCLISVCLITLMHFPH